MERIRGAIIELLRAIANDASKKDVTQSVIALLTSLNEWADVRNAVTQTVEAQRRTINHLNMRVRSLESQLKFLQVSTGSKSETDTADKQLLEGLIEKMTKEAKKDEGKDRFTLIEIE